MKPAIAFLAVALLCGCNKPATPASHVSKWEYKTVVAHNRCDDPEQWSKMANLKTDAEIKKFWQENDDCVLFPGDFDLDPILATNTDWELVSAVPQTGTIFPAGKFAGNPPNIRTPKIILIFKRPLK